MEQGIMEGMKEMALIAKLQNREISPVDFSKEIMEIYPAEFPAQEVISRPINVHITSKATANLAWIGVAGSLAWVVVEGIGVLVSTGAIYYAAAGAGAVVAIAVLVSAMRGTGKHPKQEQYTDHVRQGGVIPGHNTGNVYNINIGEGQFTINKN